MWRLMGPLAEEPQCGECTPGGRLRWLCGLSSLERCNGDRAAAAHSEPLPARAPGHERPGKPERTARR